MPFLLALLGAIVTAYIWANRAKRGAEVAREAVDIARTVKNAPRRYGFTRRANQHPVEGIDDPDIAIGGLAVAFLELDDLPTAQTRARMDVALRKHLQLDAENAQEIAVLGRWLVEESGGPTQGFERLARKLRKLDAGDSFDRLMAVLSDIADAADGPPSARQSDALADLARIFRVS